MSASADAAPFALNVHRTLFRLVLAAGNVFAWVIIFRVLFVLTGQSGVALLGVGALYALSQAITLFLTPLSGAALRRGTRRALVYGTLASTGAFGAFALLFVPGLTLSGELVFSIIASFVVLSGMHRALYWIPYTAVSEASGGTRFSFLREAVIACMPFIAGSAIAFPGGATVLFAGIVVGVVVALVPLRFVPERYERFSWSFHETFGALILPINRRMVLAAALDGIQGVTLLLIWPLAVFLILGQSYALLGIILTATLLITFLSRRLIHRVLRTLGLERSTITLATIVVSSWLLRLAANTPLYVFVVDAYYHGGSSPRRFGIEPLSFEQTADAGHFVDEYTALKEMGMALGRIAACALFIASLFFVSVPTAFAASISAAACAAGLSVFLSRHLVKSVYPMR